ncbi:MAG: M20 family metallopeptidase [Acidimicrobiia bacterium]|nr:MAG: M20 family metallopeptidase [Acidimicrobiia bacterium]
MAAKDVASQAFDDVEEELQGISRWMYEHPETAFEEHETSAKVVAFLAGNGFDVEYPAYGLDTAFAARIGSSGPEVVICCELDALPEVGHACGHNIIATAAAGAGAALVPLADELGIRVTVLGTPAEEMHGGKVDLINAGAFSDAAASIMVHPSNDDVADRQFLAINHISVDFYGKASHASSEPQLGINALDAAVQAYVNVSTLRQSLYPTDKTHGVITYGGGAPNVIPEHTSLAWYVRALTKERLDEVYAKVVACFDAAALATGCRVEIKPIGHPYTDIVPNRVMAELYVANSDALGRPMLRGTDFDPAMAGSTDMGNVSYEVPSLHPMLSIHAEPATNHQREFAAHTLTPDGEAAIRDGALGMAWTIIDLAQGDRWGEL